MYLNLSFLNRALLTIQRHCTVHHPKSADSITSQQEFAVVEHDPIISFGLGDLQRLGSAVVSYELPLILSEEQAGLIIAEFSDDASSTTLKAESTAGASSVKLSADYDKTTDTTTIMTTIIPKK